MIIRKLFKFEGAHIVRDCSSERCKKSLHGHSYIVEVKFEASKMDNGQMVVDFGLLKSTVKDFLDSFDHAYVLWDKETTEFKQFIKTFSDRYIVMPVSPSAEMFALVFFSVINRILKLTEFTNGEDPNLQLYSVIVHETATGYAEAFEGDLKALDTRQYALYTKLFFSPAIQKDWKDPDMYAKICYKDSGYAFVNPKVKLQFNISQKPKLF